MNLPTAGSNEKLQKRVPIFSVYVYYDIIVYFSMISLLVYSINSLKCSSSCYASLGLCIL